MNKNSILISSTILFLIFNFLERYGMSNYHYYDSCSLAHNNTFYCFSFSPFSFTEQQLTKTQDATRSFHKSPPRRCCLIDDRESLHKKCILGMVDAML